MFDRILFPMAAAHSSPSMAIDKHPTRLCNRCLCSGHWRVNCRWPIRCRACRNPGHIAALFNQFKILDGKQNPGKANGKEAVVSNLGRFGLESTAQLCSSSPPVFNPFGDLARDFWPTKETVPELIVPWSLRPNNSSKIVADNSQALYATLDPNFWKLSNSPSL